LGHRGAICLKAEVEHSAGANLFLDLDIKIIIPLTKLTLVLLRRKASNTALMCFVFYKAFFKKYCVEFLINDIQKSRNFIYSVIQKLENQENNLGHSSLQLTW